MICCDILALAKWQYVGLKQLTFLLWLRIEVSELQSLIEPAIKVFLLCSGVTK